MYLPIWSVIAESMMIEIKQELISYFFAAKPHDDISLINTDEYVLINIHFIYSKFNWYLPLQTNSMTNTSRTPYYNNM